MKEKGKSVFRIRSRISKFQGLQVPSTSKKIQKDIYLYCFVTVLRGRMERVVTLTRQERKGVKRKKIEKIYTQQGRKDRTEKEDNRQEGETGNKEGETGNKEGETGNKEGETGNKEGETGNKEGETGNKEGETGNKEGKYGS